MTRDAWSEQLGSLANGNDLTHYASPFNLNGQADPGVNGDAAVVADGAVVDVVFDLVPS